jgi:hypothetical protein
VGPEVPTPVGALLSSKIVRASVTQPRVLYDREERSRSVDPLCRNRFAVDYVLAWMVVRALRVLVDVFLQARRET